jgi:hypothetical protein
MDGYEFPPVRFEAMADAEALGRPELALLGA